MVHQGGRQFVFKVVPGAEPDSRIVQRTEVKVGLRLPGKVEILEGVQAGDVVVTAGQQRLQRDGMAVRVIDVPRGGPGGAGGAGAPGAAAAASGAAFGAAGAASGAASAVAKASAPARPASATASAAARATARPAGPNPCLQALEGAAAPRSAS